MNSTFLALIPKVDGPLSFVDFRMIFLCNNVYEIVSKVIVLRIKLFLLSYTSEE